MNFMEICIDKIFATFLSILPLICVIFGQQVAGKTSNFSQFSIAFLSIFDQYLVNFRPFFKFFNFKFNFELISVAFLINFYSFLVHF